MRKWRFHATRRLVFMRAEFFDNTADIDAFSEVFRAFAAQKGKK